MAMVLNKLPRELRDQIYRELLVDIQGIKIADNCLKCDFVVTKQLFPAILQVCKQVFSEASMILYEENIFYFSDSFFCQHLQDPDNFDDHINYSSCVGGLLSSRPEGEIGGFQRIKHLAYFANHSEYAEAPINLDTTTPLMGLIAGTRRSLRTLCLSWKFRNYDYSLYEVNAASFAIYMDGNIRYAIAGLKVQKVDIIVNSDDAGHYSRCEAVTRRIGSAMQLAGTNVSKKCIKRSMEVGGGVREEVKAYDEEGDLIDWPEEKNSTDKTSTDGGADDASVDSNMALMERVYDIGIHYVWTWTLTPTATMVGNEGSQTAKSVNGFHGDGCDMNKKALT